MSESIRTTFSGIMNTYINARREVFKAYSMGTLFRHELPALLKQKISSSEEYEIKGSIGQGNWAVIPWLAIMNPKITTSTQRGFYIVYLFSEDMQHLYLTFAQGVTETSREEMERRNEDIRSRVDMGEHFRKDNDFTLGSSSKAKEYVQSVAAYVRYSKDDFPSEGQLIDDLNQMIEYYEEYIHLIGLDTVDNENARKPEEFDNIDIVSHIHSYITNKGFYFTDENIKNLYLSLKTKPFVILSGISGTGKTQIVRLFAESVGATVDNGQFKMIPVRPDWSDGSDLIGYVDIKGDFQPGPLTEVLMEANKPENWNKSYFVLLDEMNLARVEYYFSDLLSVMESRRKEIGEYVSDPVVDHPEEGGLLLWNNVYIIGTVNMDETTYPFSPKVSGLIFNGGKI
ncbi:MrcB family domain-containing protein [Siminovitchia sp. 179-K 8D1 HS]|uniref:MrcB family domain-containing protein n=1 Tax=Siminovitchia sp. 179-K 8D1 HS TaxID=3142385 RepID=UPI00399FA5EE